MRFLVVFMLVAVTIANCMSEPDELKRFRRSEDLLDQDALLHQSKQPFHRDHFLEVKRDGCTTSSCEPGKICAVEECVDAGLQCGQELCAEGVSCNDNRCQGTRCGIVDCEDGRDCQLSMCNGPGIICGNTNCSSYERCFKGVCYDRSCKEPYCVSHPRPSRLTTPANYTIKNNLRPTGKDNSDSRPLTKEAGKFRYSQLLRYRSDVDFKFPTNVGGLEKKSKPPSRASKMDENNIKKISRQEEITSEARVCIKTRCEMLGGSCSVVLCTTSSSDCGGVFCNADRVCFNNTCTTYAAIHNTALCTAFDCLVWNQGESCGSVRCPDDTKCLNGVCKELCINGFCGVGTCDKATDTCNDPCKTNADCQGEKCIRGNCNIPVCGEQYCKN